MKTHENSSMLCVMYCIYRLQALTWFSHLRARVRDLPMASRKRLQQLQKLQSALAEHVVTSSSSAPSAAAAATAEAPAPAAPPAASVPEEAAPKTPPTKRARKKKNATTEVPAMPAMPANPPPKPASAPVPAPEPVPEDEVPKDPPAKRARTKKPQEPSKAEPTRKHSKAKNGQHDPPDFEISWANHSRLMAHFNLTEDEATATLASLLGPDRGGEEFWNKFRARNHANFDDEPAPSDSAAPTAGSHPAAPSTKPAPELKTEPKVEPPAKPAPAPRLLTRAERELIEDSQLRSSDDEPDDATCDYVAFDNTCDDDNDDAGDTDRDDEDEIDVSSSGGRPPCQSHPPQGPWLTSWRHSLWYSPSP